MTGCPEYTEAQPAQGDTWEVGGDCGVHILLISVSYPLWDHALEALLFSLESLCPFQACNVHTVSQRIRLSWSLSPPYRTFQLRVLNLEGFVLGDLVMNICQGSVGSTV